MSFIDDNSHLAREEIMIQCGYFRLKKNPDGTRYKSCQATDFYQAISAAHGVKLPPSSGRRVDTPGKLKITTKGILPIGSIYTSQLGLEQGDYVFCSVVDGKITIVPWVDDEDVPFNENDEVENCSLPRRTQLEITETCSYTPEQCAVG